MPLKAIANAGVRRVRRAAGMYMVVAKSGAGFLADTTINIEPDADKLAEIAILAADRVTDLGLEPRVASFSNFGDAPQLLRVIGDGGVIGPIVLGMRKPVNVLQQGATVDAIVHLTAITVARSIRLDTRAK